jgi:hypothetical protein
VACGNPRPHAHIRESSGGGADTSSLCPTKRLPSQFVPRPPSVAAGTPWPPRSTRAQRPGGARHLRDQVGGMPRREGCVPPVGGGRDAAVLPGDPADRRFDPQTDQPWHRGHPDRPTIATTTTTTRGTRRSSLTVTPAAGPGHWISLGIPYPRTTHIRRAGAATSWARRPTPGPDSGWAPRGCFGATRGRATGSVLRRLTDPW